MNMTQAALFCADKMQTVVDREITEKPRRHSLDWKASFCHQSEILPTGIRELDQLLKGGIPRGKLVEITGNVSSGKTSVLLSILAQATEKEEFVAYVDTFDSLAPESLEKAGVNPRRLLWIRCRKSVGAELGSAERAVKALDILTHAGGFGLIILDFEPVDGSRAPRIPLHCWFRLQRTIRGTSTSLIVLSQNRTTGNAAGLVLSLERRQSCWSPGGAPVSLNRPLENPSLSHLPSRSETRLQGLNSCARLLRGAVHGSVSVHCAF